MATDDLSAPLGQSKTDKAPRSRFRSACRTSLLGALGLLARRFRGLGDAGRRSVRRRADGGRAGRPARRQCRQDVRRCAAKTARPTVRTGPTGTTARRTATARPHRSLPPGSKTVTIIDGTQRQAPGRRDPGHQPTAKPAVARRAAQRAIAPRPAAEDRAGRRPAGRSLCAPGQGASRQARMRRGSRSWSAASASAPAGTGDALDKLPGAVTFAFAPYGGDLERQVARARDGRPRGAAAGADGAVRLSRQRSRARRRCSRRSTPARMSTACNG